MATDIRLKKSSVAGRIPDSSNLDYGELAINYQDGKLYYRNAGGGVKAFLDSANISDMITERQGTDSADVVNIVNATIDSDYLAEHVKSLEGDIDVIGHLIPSVDSTYDLGSSTNKWRSLYVSGNSIHLGSIVLTDSDGKLSIKDSNSALITEVNLNANNTDQLSEGSTNLYYTDARVTSLIDAAYIQARQVDLQRDSDFIKTVHYGNNERLKFGASDNLQIYSNGTNSFITEGGSGDLVLQGANIRFENGSGEYYVRTFNNGKVGLYYDNTERFETLDSGVNITGNLRINNAPASFGIDSSAVIGIVDSDYVLNRASASFPIHNQDSSLSHYEKVSFTVKTQQGVVKLQPQVTIDSSTPELVDIDFVFAGIDSGQVLNLIDSAYVESIIDSAYIGTVADFGFLAPVAGKTYTPPSGSGSDTSTVTALALRRGQEISIGHNGFVRNLLQSNSSGVIVIGDGATGLFSDIQLQPGSNRGVYLGFNGANYKLNTVDSGVNITGNLRINNAPATFGLDSSAVTALITANAIDSGVALQLLLDSSEVVQLIDSSYVQARQSGGEITIQDEGSALSTAATTLNFTGSGVTASGTGTTKTINITGGGGGGGGTTGSFNQVSVNSFTGDSSTTAFTLSSAPVSASENSVVVTINGVTQHVNSYSLSGAVITLDSAPETGDEIEMRVHDDYTANIQLRDYKSYVYTPSSSTTAFTGSDDNGATLTYDAGKVEVYLNGSRLVSGTDYTETNSSTITLGEAIDSPDTLEIVSLAKAAIADFGVAAYDSDFTTTTADQIIHTFPAASFRTVKYIAQIEHDSDNKYHSEEILLAHNGTTVGMTTYSQVLLDSNLGTFDADISGTDVRLKFTPTYTNTSVKLRAIRVNA